MAWRWNSQFCIHGLGVALGAGLGVPRGVRPSLGSVTLEGFSSLGDPRVEQRVFLPSSAAPAALPGDLGLLGSLPAAAAHPWGDPME